MTFFIAETLLHFRGSQKQLGILWNLISWFFEKTAKTSDNKVMLKFQNEVAPNNIIKKSCSIKIGYMVTSHN